MCPDAPHPADGGESPALVPQASALATDHPESTASGLDYSLPISCSNASSPSRRRRISSTRSWSFRAATKSPRAFGVYSEIVHCRQAAWMLFAKQTKAGRQRLFLKFPRSRQIHLRAQRSGEACHRCSACPDVPHPVNDGASIAPALGAFLHSPNRLAYSASGPVRPSLSACLDAPRQADDGGSPASLPEASVRRRTLFARSRVCPQVTAIAGSIPHSTAF